MLPSYEISEIERELDISDSYEKEKADRERKLFLRELFSNDSYISWLSEFTLEYPVFSNMSFSNVFASFLKEEDKENLVDLGNFYEMINLYARENNIDSKVCHGGEFFYVKYDNFLFMIAELRSCFAVKRIKSDEEIDAIDFEKMIKYNKENSKGKSYVRK